MSAVVTPPVFDSSAARPSFSIVMQNGHAVATVDAPVASACAVREALIRVPRVSSIHMRPPPAPQQNGLAAVVVHLAQLEAGDRAEDVARRRDHAVVAGQVAGVVERDRAAARAPSASVGKPARPRAAAAGRPSGGRPRSGRRAAPYSLPIVLKQCGQAVTIVARSRYRLSVSTLAAAPASGRRSRCPSAAPDRRCTTPPGRGSRSRTPAASRHVAKARATRRLRSSNAAAQPTQYRTSISPSAPGAATSATRRDLERQALRPVGAGRRRLAPRVAAPAPCSGTRSLSSAGKRDSSRTRFRRRPTILSTCSMSTGQASTHAPQVTQSQTASYGIALSTIGFSERRRLSRSSSP